MKQNLSIFGWNVFTIHPTGEVNPPSLFFTPESGSVVVLSHPGNFRRADGTTATTNPETLDGYIEVHGGVRQHFLPPWFPRWGRKYEGSVNMAVQFFDLSADQSNSLDGQKVLIDGRMRWQVAYPARFAVWARGFQATLQQTFSSAVNVFTADHTAETLVSMPYRVKVAEAWRTSREEIWAAMVADHDDDDAQENTQLELLAKLHDKMKDEEQNNQDFKYLAAVAELERACCADMVKQLVDRFGVTIIDVKVQNVSAPSIQEDLTNQRRAEIAQKAAQAQAREFRERLNALEGAEWKSIFGVFLDRVTDMAAQKLAGAVKSTAPASGGGKKGGSNA